MPLTLAGHIPDVGNVRIIEIYQRHKLLNALADVTSSTVGLHVGYGRLCNCRLSETEQFLGTTCHSQLINRI